VPRTHDHLKLHPHGLQKWAALSAACVFTDITGPSRLWGVRGGRGPIYNPGCQFTAPKEMNGLPPKSYPIPQLPRDRRDRAVTSKIQGCDYHRAFNKLHLWIRKRGVARTQTGAPPGGGALLPRSEGTGSKRVGGMEARGLARWFVCWLSCSLSYGLGCSRDSDQAHSPAEDRSSGCAPQRAESL
jgi:hypothetical protein